MIRNILSTTAVALMVAVAGCVAGQSQIGNAGEDVDLEGDEGGIRGTVTDDRLVPLPNATVLSPTLRINATSDAEGLFVLRPVPPGSHRFYVQRVGFESTSRVVEVAPGVLTQQTFSLKPLPSVQPAMYSRSRDGILGCGFTLGLGANVCSAISTNVNFSQYDTYRFNWEALGPIPGWQAAIFELEWQSRQALAHSLQQIWEVQECQNDANSRFGGSNGQSPLRIRIDQAKIQDVLRTVEFSNCGVAMQNCNEGFCKLQSRVFPGPNTVVVQQPYTTYFTEFYFDPGPEDFSAVANK